MIARSLLTLFILTACASPELHDPAASTWPELAIRDVDPLLGGVAVPPDLPPELGDRGFIGLATFVGQHADIEVLGAEPRVLELRVRQPIDWFEPEAGSFWQKVVISDWRDARLDDPVVLRTHGYDAPFDIHDIPPTHELNAYLDGLQLDVEHRYFGSSIPDAGDASTLRASQAAADMHRIVTLFREVFSGPWVSTGVSKGGMTATYHRFFFPDDVDATVAYVAPLMEGEHDARTEGMFGDDRDPVCVDAIDAWQQSLVEHVDTIVARIEAQDRFGDREEILARIDDVAFGYEWSVWQYLWAYDCEELEPIATPEAAFARVQGAFDTLDPPEGDATYLYTRFAWSHQSRHELGYPARSSARFAGLTEPVLPRVEIRTNRVPEPSFDPNLQHHMAWWFAEQADNVLMLYGEWDPWSFGAVEPTDGVLVAVAPETSHSATLPDLEPNVRDKTLDTIFNWLGVDPQVPSSAVPFRMVRDPRDDLRLVTWMDEPWGPGGQGR